MNPGPSPERARAGCPGVFARPIHRMAADGTKGAADPDGATWRHGGDPGAGAGERDELEAETKYKSAALAILGARAAERFDAEKSRAYFQRAIAAARPQERMQLRRMADASARARGTSAGDLKDAVERMGQTPPTGRQMLALRAMGLLIPPASAGIIARLRGVVLIVVLIAVLLAVGTGIIELISLPFGALGVAPSVLLGLFLVIAVLGVIAAIGRRRRDRAKAADS